MSSLDEKMCIRDSVITDGKDVIYCNNGDSMMARITGSGCMLSVLIGAFLSVDSSVYSAAACCCMYGAAGEIAAGMTRELSLIHISTAPS